MFSMLLGFGYMDAFSQMCHILLINTDFCVCLQCYYETPKFDFLCAFDS